MLIDKSELLNVLKSAHGALSDMDLYARGDEYRGTVAEANTLEALTSLRLLIEEAEQPIRSI